MKKIAVIIAAGIIVLAGSHGWADTNLPKVTLMGKTFYYYESEKGESLAGISKKFGWNIETLMKVNREVSTPLDKGTLLYYPVPTFEKSQSNNRQQSYSQPDNASQGSASQTPLTHRVKSGETVYGISKAYDIPLETLYALNPGVKDGIKAGEILKIEPTSSEPEANDAEGIIYYKVKHDDSLYGIARQHNTSIEDIYRLNPGLAYGELKSGEMIKVNVDSKAGDTYTETINEKQVAGMESYKVKRGETWESIAEKKGVSVELLKQANPGMKKLNRGDIIGIPEVEEMPVEKIFVAEDPRETTPEGRQELYNEVHDLADSSEESQQFPAEVNVAIVLSDVDSNKDMEFARGAILAVDGMKRNSYRTRLNLIDGGSDISEIISALDGFSPALIIVTSEKESPKYLSDYARERNVQLVNVFDVKDESYINNPAVIQYLAPTSYFNDEVSAYFTDTYIGSNVIIAGEPDSSDLLGERIIQALTNSEGDNVETVNVEELPELEYNAEAPLLIYGTSSKRDDIKNLLEKVSVMRDRNPLAQIRVIGRPGWITSSDHLKSLFGDNYVIMPTRFYFDTEDSRNRRFIDDFKEMYGHTPIKSYPVYSATAYDILNYFIPNIASTGGDFNASFIAQPSLQAPIELQRVSNWGGIVNPGVYVVEFAPFGTTRKITLPANPAE